MDEHAGLRLLQSVVAHCLAMAVQTGPFVGAFAVFPVQEFHISQVYLDKNGQFKDSCLHDGSFT